MKNKYKYKINIVVAEGLYLNYQDRSALFEFQHEVKNKTFSNVNEFLTFWFTTKWCDSFGKSYGSDLDKTKMGEYIWLECKDRIKKITK
jgi:hypothetical protein